MEEFIATNCSLKIKANPKNNVKCKYNKRSDSKMKIEHPASSICYTCSRTPVVLEPLSLLVVHEIQLVNFFTMKYLAEEDNLEYVR